ncbi:MAG: Carbon monoxide dehydrogenase/acetyl-CoA synthase subunit alpha [Dehalococcoidia bacterium]|nr:Carbon monoxide dehydrogenase/acetyl-CoA synthase subunit alpha [Bacillota bacterium]
MDRICRLRVSKDAIAKGFRLKHYVEILIAKFKDEFPAIVDRVEVTLITDREQVVENIKIARARYAERNKRLCGLARIVWMPKELKDFLGDDLRQRAEEEGLGADFVDKIADETVGTTGEEILPFLEEKGHLALTMDPLL